MIDDLTGILFILFGLLATVPFFRLGQIFEYPDILRQPTADIIRKYHAGGRSLTLTWFAFALAFLVLIPAVLLFDRSIRALDPDFPVLTLATVFGVIGAVFNTVGLMRWVLVVPMLTGRYVDPAAGQGRRETIEVVFEAFHTYLGATVGEFLGFTMISLWGILIGAAVIDSGILSPVFGWLAIVLALGVLVGDLEFAGWKPAGIVVAISSSLFMLWAIVVGVLLII